MCHQYNKNETSSTKRNGLTLLELLIAVGITSMVMAALTALSSAVQSGVEYGEGYGGATHHARVILDRISRTVQEASSSNEFPGAIVLTKTVGTWRFPDTLVVWHPSGTPVDPEGLPRYNELVIFSPDPNDPNELLEITVSGDTRTVPAVTDTASWLSNIDAIKKATSSKQTTSTTSLKTALPSTTTTTALGAIRFDCRLSPSDAEWTAFDAGTLDWDRISWVQGIFGQQTGMRQTWVRIEMEMVPITTSSQNDNSYAIPFLGSAALYYEMHK